MVDNFTDPVNGLLMASSTDPTHYTVGYGDGYYDVKIVDPGTHVGLSLVSGSYTDASIEVDAHLVGDVGGRYVTMACRYNSLDGDSFYRLSVRPETQEFILDRWFKGKAGVLVNWRKSDAIHGGNQSNAMQLACQGETITAKINGTQVASIEDDGSTSGQMWIGVGSFTSLHATADARFEKSLVIKKLATSGSKGPTATP